MAEAAVAGTRGRLTILQKGLYATGDLVEASLNVSIGSFLLFYLTAVCGLSGTLAGVALFLTLFVDAFADPFVGFLTDNTRSQLGRRHPFLIAACVPLAVTFALLFSVPASVKGPALFAYVLVVLLAQRVLHSSFLLPYAAMGAELSDDYKERSSVGAYRTLFNIAGNVTVTVLGYSVFMKGRDGLLDRGAYLGFGWTVAALVVLFAAVCIAGTWRLRSRMHSTQSQARPSPGAFVREMGQVAANKSFRTLFFAILVFWIAQGTAGVLALHSNRYFWALETATIQNLQFMGAVGALTGIPVAAFALRLMQKQRLCLVAVVVFCLLQFTPTVLRIAHVLPEQGPALHAILYGAQVLGGWTTTGIAVSFLGMMADIADEHEHRHGARREALYFAGTLFGTKAAIAFGLLIGGVGLDLIGFPKDIASLGPNPVIAAETLRNLGLMAGPGAAAIAVAAAVFLAGFALNRTRVEAIQADLAARRAGA